MDQTSNNETKLLEMLALFKKNTSLDVVIEAGLEDGEILMVIF